MSSRSAPKNFLKKLNEDTPAHAQIEFVESIRLTPELELERYALANGLQVLHLQDKSAPIIALHTWFDVGSRHERPGKTGLAHLFEHLMFNEMEGLAPGEFDRRMESAGADNNASTWLDFTQYEEAFPKSQLAKVMELEALRMGKLLLQQAQLDSEKEVVANERRYRVEDDVEGKAEELLWKLAFQKHSYHWPTIGWMEDIQNFEVEDCLDFYRE
ncbi:MAG: insulinase family protein, partial [Polyangiaceae bacterium]|nr:insulinase family protein [Polyangiaceae bacterium]